MTLNQCSKADLLWVFERLQIRCKWEIQSALSDLALEKERQRISEAEKYCKLAAQKRREYCDILEPFEGRKLVDIPLPVLEKADQAIREAAEADKKWAKLMDLDL